MLKRSCLAALLFLALTSGSAKADFAGYYFTYADLQQIFVQSQQYFVLDNDGTVDPSLNHLHFTNIDVTDGMFTGTLWAPVVQPDVPQVTVPVAGKLTIHTDVGPFGIPSGQGLYYEIAFFWAHANDCDSQYMSYDGAIRFRGYVGGKMQANIAGTIRSTVPDCGYVDYPFSPQPFSGKLTK